MKPKNKGRTIFYECCDLTKKVYLNYIFPILVRAGNELINSAFVTVNSLPNDPSSFMIEKHTPRHMCTQWQALSPPSILHINICIYMYLIAGADIL